jgi:hypothetical protein
MEEAIKDAAAPVGRVDTPFIDNRDALAMTAKSKRAKELARGVAAPFVVRLDAQTIKRLDALAKTLDPWRNSRSQVVRMCVECGLNYLESRAGKGKRA